MVHESFLTSRSEFFRRALNGNWQEAETRVIKLPDDDPEIVALYINFVYTGQLSTAKINEKRISALGLLEFYDCIEEEHDTLFSIFILGEKLQDVKAKNATMAAMLDLSRSRRPDSCWLMPTVRTINRIYENTPPGSLIRRFIVRIWSSCSLRSIVNSANLMHEDFKEDVIQLAEKNYKPVKFNISATSGLERYLEKEETWSAATATYSQALNPKKPYHRPYGH